MDALPKKLGRLAGPEWRATRERAIASLDPICGICHKWIDITAPMHTPLAVEVDHIVPRSRGGAWYELSNLQLTHHTCNRKKGSKMDSDYPSGKVENPVPLSNPW